MTDVQALRKGLDSLHRALDKDEFQEQIANELLYLQSYTRERRQLLESLEIRYKLYRALLEHIQQKLLTEDEQEGTLRNGAAIIADDLEAIESGILTIERELEAIEIKRKVMALFEMSAPKGVDLSSLSTATLKRLGETARESEL